MIVSNWQRWHSPYIQREHNLSHSFVTSLPSLMALTTCLITLSCFLGLMLSLPFIIVLSPHHVWCWRLYTFYPTPAFPATYRFFCLDRQTLAAQGFRGFSRIFYSSNKGYTNISCCVFCLLALCIFYIYIKEGMGRAVY